MMETGHHYLSRWFGTPKTFLGRLVYGGAGSSKDERSPGLRMLHRWCEYTKFLEDWPANGRQKYLEYNYVIRSIVPKEQLLEYRVKEGRGPLCKFLDKPLPTDLKADVARPFPRVNDRAYLQREFDKINKIRIVIYKEKRKGRDRRYTIYMKCYLELINQTNSEINDVKLLREISGFCL